MVNKNKTIINNKNIIQITGDIKNKQKSNPRKQHSAGPPLSAFHIQNPRIIRDATPQNTFSNSTGLEDELRKIRFMQEMRNPLSTKSPYSIFDNGSNTFERQGNTEGQEIPQSPHISQDDYFTQPETREFTQQRAFNVPRQFQRFNSLDMSDSITPIQEQTSIFSSFGSRFRPTPVKGVQFTAPDETEDETSEFSYIPQLGELKPSDTKGTTSKFFESPFTRKDALGNFARFPPPNKIYEAPPSFQTPYRAAGQAELEDEAIIEYPEEELKKDYDEITKAQEDIKKSMLKNKVSDTIKSAIIKKAYLNKKDRKEEGENMKSEDKPEKITAEMLEEKNRAKRVKEEVQRIESEVERNKRLKEEQKTAREKLAEELTRQKAIKEKYETVTNSLKTLIASGEAKVKKESIVKNQIKELLKDKTFIEYTGAKNIRALTDPQKLLNFVNAGSTKVIEQIKFLEESNKDSPIKRIPPKETPKIVQLKDVYNAPVKQAGGAMASSIPKSIRK